MRFILTITAAIILVSCGDGRRPTPDETKVQSYPAWQPAPTDELPIPQS